MHSAGFLALGSPFGRPSRLRLSSQLSSRCPAWHRTFRQWLVATVVPDYSCGSARDLHPTSLEAPDTGAPTCVQVVNAAFVAVPRPRGQGRVLERRRSRSIALPCSRHPCPNRSSRCSTRLGLV